ncbi:MAG: hypothetical protein KQH53_10535 [Desulfarculaceae bacterium]|nr:hypothetical protein [Desulfarculaceae bacterium]
MIKVDTVLLAAIIDACFDLSMDLSLPHKRRKEFLALGKRLRACLVNVVTARFKEGTQAVLEANKRLKAINAELKKSLEKMEALAKALDDLAELVGILDGLLSMATKFV